MRLIGNPNQLPSGVSTPEGPHTKPRVCAVIPHRTEDPEGFIETRNECPCGQQIIVSVAAVREMASLIGLVSADEVNALKERLEGAEAELNDIQITARKIDEAEKTLEEVAA